MTKKITQPITAYTVVKPDDTPMPPPAHDIMSESIKRPGALTGATYKIKPPGSDHALYITINDITLNPGTDHEQRRPFEIFINSKNMEQFQWVVALTRLMSGVFRKGGDVAFLVEELRSVFDPNGGYFKRGGKFMPSLVAEIGDVLERHLMGLGMVQAPEIDTSVAALIAEKQAAVQGEGGGGYPDSATVCAGCSTKAVVIMDGCQTCLSCGASKCQ